MAQLTPPRRPNRPGDELVVLRTSLHILYLSYLPLTLSDDFVARSDDELTLRRGARLVLLELDDDFGDGWYLGRLLHDGRTGLFPGGEFSFLECCCLI
jgi:hypothetical protein